MATVIEIAIIGVLAFVAVCLPRCVVSCPVVLAMQS